ncbi:GNAT family N-acetyltransferase [Acuticoccus mangrovi]|uniref:GNAT family N-acetyltransferase n=1 Tax=Acuticoccus mangrovi TaxID=2796142 RepID=A0A934IPM0_9HYPH|nr:GNAT family N-acetyltransferase [Acuticoccus mangrovi]MBJ3776346.1 GNAT family N-acetyltransferase [Acuticoccus mangrovi]
MTIAPPTWAATDFHTVDLSVDDVPAVFALYAESLAAVPDPAAVRADAPSFFEKIFAVGGEIIGLFDGLVMIGYGVIRPELEEEHDRVGLDRVVPADAPMRVLDGSAVRPAYWRHGLQRTTIDARIARAAELGATHVIAKASPGNVPSMRNLTKQGFHILGRVMKPYGWRYVHHRPVHLTAAEPIEGEWYPAHDVDGAEAMFREGRAAFAAKRDDAGEPMLKFTLGPDAPR